MAIVAIVGLGTANTGHAEGAIPADDGWRRTADGWERVETWSAHGVHGAARDRAQSTSRSDCHPAVLALFQVLAVATGFGLIPALPPRRRTKAASKGEETPVMTRAA